MNKIRIAVGLSGGVDSSVAAALLLEEGYDVTGITMKIYDETVALNESGKHACYGPGEEEDIEAAASVCDKLGIPFHVIDLTAVYKKHVIDYFRYEYLHGRTPNPCIVCNRKLKFGFLLEKAKGMGVDFDMFATGHYARVEKSGQYWLLKKAVDPLKDQTYFLYTLTIDQLARIRFPLGNYTKQETRKLAETLGLATADRPESQDFISGGNYASLFHIDEIKKGDILDTEGNVIGRHRGIIHYTLGQRQGLGIASTRPLYVMKIDAEKNTIVVGGIEQLFSKELIASDINLISLKRLDEPHNVTAKIRLNHKEVNATVYPLGTGRAKIIFQHPQMAVAPGQSVVLYSGDTVLGGGIIEQPIETTE